MLVAFLSMWLAAAGAAAVKPPLERADAPASVSELAPGRGEAPSDPEIATRARANLVSLFSTDDYPPEAWRNGEEGMVAVRLTVDPNGKVADCVVTISSGFPSLDVQTCRIIWMRAQFIPARDAEGAAVQDTYNQRIRWELPKGSPGEIEEQYSRFILTIDATKSVLDCRFEASPDWQKDDSGCAKVVEHMRRLVASAPEWIEFSGKQLVLEVQHRVGDPQGGIELGERAGETSLALSRLYLTIEPGGKVKSCSRDSWGAVRAEAWMGCGAAERWQFEKLPDNEANKSDRQLTIVNAIYLQRPATDAPGDQSVRQ